MPNILNDIYRYRLQKIDLTHHVLKNHIIPIHRHRDSDKLSTESDSSMCKHICRGQIESLEWLSHRLPIFVYSILFN